MTRSSVPIVPRSAIALLAAGGMALLAARAGGEEVHFRTDVMAAISKAGCNAGGCHGNGNGKGGFKLSLRGQDPDLDWVALTRDQGSRRVNLNQPEGSLLLLKATAAIAHEGGQRFRPTSPEYAVFLEWLRTGAPDSHGPRLTKLEVTPRERVLIEPEMEVALHAVAHFSDGTQRDVTRFAVYEPNNHTARVTPDGLVKRERPGETTVLVRYLDRQVPVRLAFVPARPGWVWQEPPTNNYIDEQVFAKLRRLRVNPSALCDDVTYLRRAHLDLLGTIPTAGEARAFLADPDPNKRARLVDQLLAREEFADFWALKWADLLKIEERQLDAEGMRRFHGWIRESLAGNKPLDQFARELVAARGSTYENPAANWWRANRDPVTRAENTARVFLGVQLNCAQCHNHPFERWTQDDYYDWAGLFARVDYRLVDNKRTDKNDKNEFKGDQVVLLKAQGTVTNPRTGEPARPRFLGGAAPRIGEGRDEILELADWLAHSPMFARMQVNRIWFHLLGRGLVDPVDDFRASNPPAHPQLLDKLASDFVEHGYDLRHVIRRIMHSRVYQLDWLPNDSNAEDEENAARAVVRRLSAEQALDSIALALDTSLPIDNFPAGTRLAQVPEGRKHYKPLKTEVDRFAAVFGKPPRLIASECERSNETTMPQVFQLISGPLIQQLLAQPDNRLDAMLRSSAGNQQLIEELFQHTLSRPPSREEEESGLGHLAKAADRRRAAEDLTWALLNSKEFLLRH
ncbi:MAG: DUF1549 and DUF1553 domain-containing protein [Verrucomicrobiota bacterium]|nr:DUF1549 and DUF1553 domain-containing protein [Verrucomicrobiota bacterium]